LKYFYIFKNKYLLDLNAKNRYRYISFSFVLQNMYILFK